MVGQSVVIPSYDADRFSDEALTDPFGHLERIRDLGPVVILDAHDVYVVARYAEVRAVLGDPETFCSGQGVGLNPFINEAGRGTTLMSDGEQHERLRSVIGRPLTPKAPAQLRPDADVLAAALADQVTAGGWFDGISDLAEVLPAPGVPDLPGWPGNGQEQLLGWAGATFDGLGPINGRTVAAGPGSWRGPPSPRRSPPRRCPPVRWVRGSWPLQIVARSMPDSAQWRSSTTWARRSTPRSPHWVNGPLAVLHPPGPVLHPPGSVGPPS